MSDVIVLCYHALSPTWEADLSTTPERFERQVRLLLHRGYKGVSFTDAVSTRSSDKLLAVTFDDAYHSVIELALPILRRAGIPATVFVPTDYIGVVGPMRWPGIDCWLNGPSEHELVPMSWSDLKSLADAGWEIGSHTGSHPHLTDLDDGVLADELARSKAACESHVPGVCTSLAYPYGDLDSRVVAAAAAAGYTAGASLPDRLDLAGPLEWPRIGIYRVDDDRRFRLKVSPTIRRLRSSDAWDLALKMRALRSDG